MGLLFGLPGQRSGMFVSFRNALTTSIAFEAVEKKHRRGGNEIAIRAIYRVSWLFRFIKEKDAPGLPACTQSGIIISIQVI